MAEQEIWREFANEVPTEPRSVLLYHPGLSELTGSTWCSIWHYNAQSGEWEDRSSHTARVDDWAAEAIENEATHWRYIDPPGTESAETAAALRELDAIMLEMVNTRVSEIAHPLAPLSSVLYQRWTELHRPSTDPEVTGSRDALRSLVAGVARFLKVEMPKGEKSNG